MSHVNSEPGKPSLPFKWPLLFAWLTATLLSLLITYQNLPFIRQAGLGLGFWELFLREVVIWYSAVVLLPLVLVLAVRFPVAGPQRWRNLALHAAFAPVFVLAQVLLFATARYALFEQHLMPEAPFADAVFIVYRRFFAFFLFVYAGTVAALQAWRQSVERREHALSQARLETMLQESRLENLRAQLDPHFLFNALNAISSLVTREPARARQMIARLSSLLRLSLQQEGKGLVPLTRELEMLGVYLEIQQLRFGDRLRVTLEIDDRAENALLPQLLLQPIVENAIHHGIERRADAGRIDIRVQEGAGRLCIRVIDDGPGFEGPPDEHIGLGNSRARLALHFGDRAQLVCENDPAGGACVRIDMPLTFANAGGGDE